MIVCMSEHSIGQFIAGTANPLSKRVSSSMIPVWTRVEGLGVVNRRRVEGLGDSCGGTRGLVWNLEGLVWNLEGLVWNLEGLVWTRD